MGYVGRAGLVRRTYDAFSAPNCHRGANISSSRMREFCIRRNLNQAHHLGRGLDLAFLLRALQGPLYSPPSGGSGLVARFNDHDVEASPRAYLSDA
jgi:hypothetical protein